MTKISKILKEEIKEDYVPKVRGAKIWKLLTRLIYVAETEEESNRNTASRN